MDPAVARLTADQLSMAAARFSEVQAARRLQAKQERTRSNEIRAGEFLERFQAELAELLRPHFGEVMEGVEEPVTAELYRQVRDLISDHTEQLDAAGVPEGFLYGGKS
jgi:hypothetical protein